MSKSKDCTGQYTDYLAFFDAVKIGDLFEIQRLIRTGISPDIQENNEGLTLVMMSIKHNKKNVFEMLIKAGASLRIKNNYGLTAISYALILLDVPIISYVEILLEYGPSVHRDADISSLLSRAILIGNASIVEMLINYGFFRQRKKDIFDELQNRTRGINKHELVPMIETKKNALNLDLHYPNNQTHLIRATQYQNKDIVKLLLRGGADVEIQDESHKTALSYAISSQSIQNDRNSIIDMLLENVEHKFYIGIDPTISSSSSSSSNVLINNRILFDVITKSRVLCLNKLLEHKFIYLDFETMYEMYEMLETLMSEDIFMRIY